MKKTITTIAFGLLSIYLSAQIPNYVPSNGLVGWWPFSGNANDLSGNNLNGTVNGSTLTTDRFGVVNSAYYFNGTSNKIAIPNLGNLTEFSFSIWVKSDGENGIASRGFFGSSGFWTVGHLHAGASNADIGIALADNGTNNPVITTTYNLNNLNWTNITYTFKSSNNVYLYINGVEVANAPSTSVTTLFNSLTVGYIHNGNRYWNGKIDDLGFWNRVLTQQEVTNLFNGGICYQNITVTDTLLINTGVTGFDPVTYQNTIKVWPNPTNDHITIDNGNISNLTGYQIKITNSLNQQVFQSAITQQQFYVDLSTWTGNGIYFVHIIDGQGNTIDIKKIILQ